MQGASSRAAALNERYLRRISADLHDGPAQLLALASLRLGSPHLGADANSQEAAELQKIRSFLDEAMGDIRNICRGLTLPQIETMELSDLLSSVVRAHEQRTGTSVELSLPDHDPQLSQSEKICIYRLVQEGLNNATRHAGGVGQRVAAVSRTSIWTSRLRIRDLASRSGRRATAASASPACASASRAWAATSGSKALPPVHAFA